MWQRYFVSWILALVGISPLYASGTIPGVLGEAKPAQYISESGELNNITNKIYSIDANQFGVFVAAGDNVYIARSQEDKSMGNFYPVPISHDWLIYRSDPIQQSITAVIKNNSGTGKPSLSQVDLGFSSSGTIYGEMRRWRGDERSDGKCMSEWYYPGDGDVDYCDQFQVSIKSMLYEITPDEQGLNQYAVNIKPTYNATYPFIFNDKTAGDRLIAGLTKSSEATLEGQKSNGYMSDLLQQKDSSIGGDIDVASNAGIIITPAKDTSVDLIGAGSQRDAYYSVYNNETHHESPLVKLDWDPNFFSVQNGAMVQWNRYIFVGIYQGLISGILPLNGAALPSNWMDLNQNWKWNSAPQCQAGNEIENCSALLGTVTSLGTVWKNLLVGTKDHGIYIFTILSVPENYNGSQPILRLDAHIPFADAQSKSVNAIKGYRGKDKKITVYYGNDAGLFQFNLEN
ncbi:hypothetical protein N8865_02965 [Francisellaceae bacterium]|nr:hypothetical protein [Francisellaceae bacterium]